MTQTVSAATKSADTRRKTNPANPQTAAPELPAVGWDDRVFGNQAMLRLQRKCSCGGKPDCDCDSHEKKQKGSLHRAAVAGGGGPAEAPPIVHEVLRSPGQTLDPGTRAFFEARFGRDLSAVRVHTTPDAAQSARAVNALAYTVGSHLVFDHGRYAPHTSGGGELLAHELAHVIQQGGRRTVPNRLAIGSPTDAFEAKANEMAREVSRPGNAAASAARISTAAPAAQLPQVQRQDPGGGSQKTIADDPSQNAGQLWSPPGAPGIKIKASVKIDAAPTIFRQQRGAWLDVGISKRITGKGTAQVSGPDAASYEFGFLQLGRPFEVYRVTYHESGAPAGPGKDITADRTMAIRKALPAVDHATPWYDNKSAPGPSASVDYSDLPANSFQTSLQKNGTSYTVSGIACESHLATAFAVKGPDGVFNMLDTFYWNVNWCEDLPPGTDLSKPKNGSPVRIEPVDDCTAGPCGAGDFAKMNTPRSSDTYVAAVKGADVPPSTFDGPGTFPIGCK